MIKQNSASFRDPAGHVYWHENHIYRTVMPNFVQAFETVRQSTIIKTWIEKGILWPEQSVDKAILGEIGKEAHAVLHHPVFPFISYPYEWPFELLKEAALLQLQLMQEGLEHNIILNDASAFNIQFDGIRPVFIDHLAFRPYEKGEFWQAHKQFFEQFLNPLLVQSYCRVPFQGLYRGNLYGCATQDIARLLPLRRKFNWRVILHILLQTHFDQAVIKKPPASGREMPRAGLAQLWHSLEKWVRALPNHAAKTHWQLYPETHSYRLDLYQQKKTFIADIIFKLQPGLVWDLGCNAGLFSELALQSGAKRVIGFDNDHSALSRAIQLAKTKQLAFTPLYMDMTNPTPAQGWAQVERLGLATRQKPDFILALALIHHWAIAANIPLSMIIDYLLTLAPRGIIEFVPKSDVMVQAMLSRRKDIFPNYNLEHFMQCLTQKAQIVSTLELGENGRVLVAYESLK